MKTRFLYGILFVSLVFAVASYGQTVDETTVGSALNKIIDFVLKYIAPGLCGLIFIKGAVDMASGRPEAAKTMIMAIVGLILALAARAIIKYITGITIS